MSSHGSVQSWIHFETFITTGVLRDPACHAGDWEGVQPWPRQLPVGRGLDLFTRASKANHIASMVPKGLGSVAITLGYNVGINPGY